MAYQWRLGSRHPDEDICNMYAGADLYGLGAGIYPKDRVPDCPAHPNCLCHLSPIYKSELKNDPDLANVEEKGDAWLKKQPLHVRQSILGVKGEKEWQEGRLSWTEKAETLGGIKIRNISGVLGSGDSADKDDTTFVLEPNINYFDKKAIEKRFSKFAEDSTTYNEEHAIVITKSNKVYHFTGTAGKVNILELPVKELKGSHVIHNHLTYKDPEAFYSRDDFQVLMSCQLGDLDLCIGNEHFRLWYNGLGMDSEKVEEWYDDMRMEVLKSYYEKGYGAVQNEKREVFQKIMELAPDLFNLKVVK